MSPDLDQLRSLTDKVDLAIREAKLNQAFLDFQSAAKSAEAQKPNETKPETIPLTDKNRFLMVGGDPTDVLLLYNAGPHAPHVALNLRGELVFADDRADVCLAQIPAAWHLR